MMLAAMLAVALLAASPALAQDEPAVVADAKAKEAKAGGAKAEAECKDGVITAQAGGVVAKAPCAPPPPPPPKAPPAPPPPPPSAAPEGRSGSATPARCGSAAPARCGSAAPARCGSGPGSGEGTAAVGRYQRCLAVRAGRGCSAGWRWPLGPQVPQVAAANTSEEEGVGPRGPTPCCGGGQSLRIALSKQARYTVRVSRELAIQSLLHQPI